jgi:hypothetical protein
MKMSHILEKLILQLGFNGTTMKSVEVTLIHSWQQKIKESQLKDMP